MYGQRPAEGTNHKRAWSWPDYEIPTLDRSHLDDISTDAEVFDEFWAKFEGTDFDEKVSLIERAYDDPSLMEDADFVYEILNDLNKAATTISEREIFAGMVKRFVMKKHMPNDRQSFVDVRSLSGLSFSPQTLIKRRNYSPVCLFTYSSSKRRINF